MEFRETALPGVLIVDSDVFEDDRGSFTRAWRPDEFRARGLETHIEQCMMAYNRRRGTVRGMHFQAPPFDEVKLVRATRGVVYDVILDLRPESPTFKKWIAVELSADNHRIVYIPKGLAHGYQTLSDDAELMYFVSADYSPAHQRGVRYSDPAFGITWPLGAPSAINERDATYPDFTG
jgi:dTDP-4-dehydrorhamnose 3,5-epimerase